MTEFVRCNFRDHRKSLSPHPVERVPIELFKNTFNNSLFKCCLHCRTYARQMYATQRKRKIEKRALDDSVHTCLKCDNLLVEGSCLICRSRDKTSRQSRKANDRKVKLERILQTKVCCAHCNKIFVKNPNAEFGFITLDSLENVDITLIEFRNLEFDHLTEEEQVKKYGRSFGPKKNGVARIHSYASKLMEAQKCELLCLACHRFKTQQRYKRTSRVCALRQQKQEIVKAEKLRIGKCELCNGEIDSKNLTYYEFDHIERSTKLFDIAKIVNSDMLMFSVPLLQTELSKCRLVCVDFVI